MSEADIDKQLVLATYNNIHKSKWASNGFTGPKIQNTCTRARDNGTERWEPMEPMEPVQDRADVRCGGTGSEESCGRRWANAGLEMAERRYKLLCT